MTFSPLTRTWTRTTAGPLQARSERTIDGRVRVPSASQSGRVSSQQRAGIQSAGHVPALFTARYANPGLAYHPAAKIRITLGAPRFRLPYVLAASIPELAPTWSIMQKAQPVFDALYVQLLEQRGGVDVLRQRFAEVAADAGVDQLVLLCFEDLRKPGLFCHRRVFAAWWTDQTGRQVAELPEA